MNPRNLAVAASGDGDYWPDPVALAECNTLTAADVEPYRALFLEWGEVEREGYDLDAILTDPADWNITVPRFFHWLAATYPDRLNHPTLPEGEPMTDTTTTARPDLVVTMANGYHAGDVVYYSGGAVPRDRIVVACPDDYTSWGDDEFHVWMQPDGQGNVTPGWTSRREVSLVSCPHVAQPEPGIVAPGGGPFHLGDRVLIRGLFDGDKEATVTDSGNHRPDPMPYPVVWSDVIGPTPSWIGADQVSLVSCPHAEGQAEADPLDIAPFQVGDRVRYIASVAGQGLSGEREVSAVHGTGFVDLVHTGDERIPHGRHAYRMCSVEHLELVRRATVSVEAEPSPEGDSTTEAPRKHGWVDGALYFEGVPVPVELTGEGVARHVNTGRGYHAPRQIIRSFIEALPSDALAKHRDEIVRWAETTQVRGRVDEFIADPTNEFLFDNGAYVGGFIHTWAEHAPRTEQPTPVAVPQGGQPEPQLVPWGPDHPEWLGWWERARSTAERFGYGSQYDILAERMGGPARQTYEYVTIAVDVRVPAGEGVPMDDAVDAIRQRGFRVTSRRPE